MVLNEARSAVDQADVIVDTVVLRVGMDEYRQPNAMLKVINRLKGPALPRIVVSESGGDCGIPIREPGRYGRVLLKRYIGRDGRPRWFAPSYLNTGGDPFSDTFDRAIDKVLKNRRSNLFAGTLWY